MKRSLLLMAILALSISIFSQQQIGNGDMELWEPTTAEIAEPLNWNSFKTATGTWNSFSGQQITYSTSARPGSAGLKSAVIWSRSAGFGVIANGNMTLGRIEMGSTTAASSSNYNYSSITDPNYSESLTNTPDSIVFWVKYKPVTAASNLARISAVIHNNTDGYKDPNDVGNANTVASAILNFPTTSNQWVRKSVPFSYTGNGAVASFILTTFTSNSIPGGGSANDSLWVDDVQLIYNPVNQSVIANDDNVSTFQDTPVNISVLNNDTDPENDFDGASLNVTTNPTNGTVNVNTITGEITYTPNAGYFGNDSFEYEICDNGTPVYCDVATVNITVVEVIVGNNPIIANDDIAITDMNVPVTTNVLANDQDFENQIDNTTLSVTVQPTNGTTSVNLLTGEITYTPNLNFFGNDSYTYSICDAGTPAITCDEAVVSVTVNLTWGVDEVTESEIQILVNGNAISILGENLSGNYSIYTTNGTLVQKGEIQPNIILQNPTGIYFLQIDSNIGLLTKKVVIL